MIVKLLLGYIPREEKLRVGRGFTRLQMLRVKTGFCCRDTAMPCRMKNKESTEHTQGNKIQAREAQRAQETRRSA